DFPFHNIIGGKDYNFREGKYKVIFYKYDKYVIWGMTARILENFLNLYKEFYNNQKATK
ncbi:coenzyme A pyrophosphatase, partial [Clostridium perfringens]|nr:coenzyme A pyrophosphatase [Clostridium perfringens]